MTQEASTVVGPTRSMWRMRLISALRTALACGMVGGATLYGPEFFVKDIKFAAFSYLTVVLIVPDATLGLALRGCWHALCATAQVVPLAVLARWWAIPDQEGVPVGAAVLAASAAAFLVALPDCTHLTAKRIAFGQIVLVCTDTVLIGRGVMHPVYVAASTGLGVMASVLALLLPYPDLASYKVAELYQLYGESAHERINLYWKAKDMNMISHMKMQQLLSRAKPLAENGAKLLQCITTLQEGMRWERRPWCRYSKPNPTCLRTLQTMERQIRGMEYSLASSFPAFQIQQTNQDQLSNILQAVSSKLEQQQPPKQESQKPSSAPAPAWLHFFTSCADNLTREDNNPAKNEPSSSTSFFTTLRGRLEFAFKCSVSLSLAVLLGLIFDRENACWAGLTVAISLVEGRQAVFAVVNARFQGTAVGSVYGVISCFLLHREELRLVAALLPWVVFASGFLRHSRMYGQAGGVTAAIGALLILGRKDYGDPTGFAIARLAEVFVGLSVFAAVEVSLQPLRAATLATSRLSQTLCSLEEWLKDENLDGKGRNNKLDCLQVSELGRFVGEAEVEPDFWCSPFPASCYRRVMGSLANVADLMEFVDRDFETLSKSSETSSDYEYWRERVNNELGICRETIRSSRVYLADSRDEKPSVDLEAGDFRNIDKINEQREGVSQAMGAIEFCVTSLTKEIDYIKMCIVEICG